MKTILWPYKMGSKSCRTLARELGALRVFSDRHYRPKRNHRIINWGNSSFGSWNGDVINTPEAVRKASNKLLTARTLSRVGVSIPEHTTVHSEAYSWAEEGHGVYCRKSLTSHGGRDIIFTSNMLEVVQSPLYTKGILVDREFRVHVYGGDVIDYTEKKRMSSDRMEEDGVIFNNFIRNFNNGWVFCRYGIELPDEVRGESIKAVHSLGLYFGAVDVVISTDGTVYIIEVNTAPGLEGTTLTAYVNAIGGM